MWKGAHGGERPLRAHLSRFLDTEAALKDRVCGTGIETMGRGICDILHE